MSVPAPEPVAQPRFSWPADYYSGPTPAPVLPRWAPFGCGAAAVVVLVIVFAGGAFLASGGLVDLMDMVFGMTLGEMRGMYEAEVTPAQKKALETEIETLRKNLREKKISVASLDPVLQAMRRGTANEKLNPKEVGEITAAARKANQSSSRRVDESSSRRANPTDNSTTRRLDDSTTR